MPKQVSKADKQQDKLQKDIQATLKEAEALQAEVQADIAEYRDNLSLEELKRFARACDWMQYWRDCPTPLCRRRHRCTGHAYDCYFGRLRRYGEEAQAWIEAGTHALERGWSARQAAKYADLALLSHVKHRDGLPRYGGRKRWRWVKLGEEEAGDALSAVWPGR